MLRQTNPEPQRQTPRGADVCAHVWAFDGMPSLPSSATERGIKASTG